jgi:alpha-mannosidase
MAAYLELYCNGRPVPCQLEREQSNVPIDWRKRVVFRAELAPSEMNRFDARIEMVNRRPAVALKERGGAIRLKTAELEVTINTRTGLVDRYRAGGVDYLKAGAFRPIVMQDSVDPWEMSAIAFRKVAGSFKLMSAKEGTLFSGLRGAPIKSVRVIEDGEVRTVVEAVFAYGDSRICQRYLLPKAGTEMGVETLVHWNEKDRMLKLSVPTLCSDAKYLGQAAYGVGELPTNGNEAVAQKWTAAVSRRPSAVFFPGNSFRNSSWPRAASSVCDWCAAKPSSFSSVV